MNDIVGVEVRCGYRLLLTFENGERREVDVSRLTPFDGVFAPLSDPDYFRQVRVNRELGTIVWPNGADFCPDVLFGTGSMAAT
ncbi:MAG: DUF2442 domain-containing protein [Phycisphaerae bacterium]